jgi:hypothetical protein
MLFRYPSGPLFANAKSGQPGLVHPTAEVAEVRGGKAKTVIPLRPPASFAVELCVQMSHGLI